ncbi:glucosylceramidase [Alginatibacterium sediminis]|uniref:Glucosylceramidase n=1 Tax=Alginatibacterium sediminis TaxID=2164068 RepID=A0A420E6I4_9ALTE|nr:GH116 family glycosyl hydrolase [Alginatibacterium sediminis]RKF13241.1 glucosylceramidase [Alginatibacterium sediminis]
MLDQYLSHGSYAGKVSKLMQAGLADDFKQPWYTPLDTSPDSTGIALGGIGSCYTLTPAGTTPVFNLLPGIQVRDSSHDGLRLEDYYFSQYSCDKQELYIVNFSDFCQRLKFYPLFNALEQALLNAFEDSPERSLEKLNTALEESHFYSWNRASLSRWRIELSETTQRLLADPKSSVIERNRAWILDYFDGAIGIKSEQQSSLTTDWHQESYLGQQAWPSAEVDYEALYPVARQGFNNEDGISISKYHYSPIVAGNAEMCALPISFTRIKLTNNSKHTRHFNLVRCLENICGYQVLKDRPGIQDASFTLVRSAKNQNTSVHNDQLPGHKIKHLVQQGESMERSDFAGEVCMSISAPDSCCISAKPYFYSCHQERVVSGALASGHISEHFDVGIHCGRELSSSALCVSGELAPGESVEVLFSLSLDFASINLPGLQSQKNYCLQFPSSKQRALNIAQFALRHEAKLRSDFVDQLERLYPNNVATQISEQPAQSKRMKTLALNTLSFLAEATVWDCEQRFLVRECADYPFFNSLDVYFYGSFGLCALLPQLDGMVMRHFGQAIIASGNDVRRHHEYVGHDYADLPSPKLEGPRSVFGAVIHDLGSPFDARPDAYDWHNVKEWKDLAPKYILMVLRHYRLTGDVSVITDCWNACKAAMQHLRAMVEDGQQFPLTRGTDDTFDNLSSHGISVYCGSLWIAGLQAYAEIASLMEQTALSSEYQLLADSARIEFNTALWDEDEGYYHFYVTPLQMEDVQLHKRDQLEFALKSSVHAQSLNWTQVQDDASFIRAINQWLHTDHQWTTEEYQALELLWNMHCQEAWPQTANRRQRRCMRKLALLASGDFWNASFYNKIRNDSDDSFADQLLADSYCNLLGLKAIASEQQKVRSLQRVFDINFKANSARIGAANLVGLNGEPKEWFNFQAHDVWIGVQYSLVCAMYEVGLNEQALELLEASYQNLYDDARIPFAAPEGFNGTSRIELEKLTGFAIPAQSLLEQLQSCGLVLDDRRISAEIPRDFEAYSAVVSSIDLSVDEQQRLFQLLHHTGLRYTAGRYFRPGMIFALPMLLGSALA